jgi:hypothetical protein
MGYKMLLFFIAVCCSGCSIIMTDPIEPHIAVEEKAFIERIKKEKKQQENLNDRNKTRPKPVPALSASSNS